MVTMVTRCRGSLSQLPVVEMSWGKKSKKKTSFLINFCFLINFIRHTGPMITMVTMVARCTGSLSQLPVVEMIWGKKFKKKPSVLINFHFLVSFIRHTGPMVTMDTRCTGSLSQLPVVEMSWGKKSKKKPSVLFHFVFWSMSSDTLVPWSPWSPGAQAAYLSFQWSKGAGEKNLRKNQVFWSTFVFWSILSDTLVLLSPWSPGAQAAYLSFQWSKWAGGKI